MTNVEEELDTDRFIKESNFNVIKDCLHGVAKVPCSPGEDQSENVSSVNANAANIHSSEYLSTGLGTLVLIIFFVINARLRTPA